MEPGTWQRDVTVHMSVKPYKLSPVINLFFALLLVAQVVLPFVHAVSEPGYRPGVTTTSFAGEEASPHAPDRHDPLHCDFCRLIGTSRPYLTPETPLDAPSVHFTYQFVHHRDYAFSSVFSRADFLRRAPPSTLLS